MARRAAEDGSPAACLARYDALLAEGASDVAAGFRALQAFGLLWPIDGVSAAASPARPDSSGPEA